MTHSVEKDAALRGLTFRVEAACDGYANLMDSDVPDDVIDSDAYQQGARDAAEGIRSVVRVLPPDTQADYLLDGSPEAVAIVREARGLPPLDTSAPPPGIGDSK